MSRTQLRALVPAMQWDKTLAGIGLGTAQVVVVAEPSAVASAAQRIAHVPLETWKGYLEFRFISDHAQFLPKAFDDAYFDFYRHTLYDVPRQRDRRKRGVSLPDESLE